MEKDTIDRNTISVTPVNNYAAPNYPSLLDANNNPDLLQKLPSRWQKNAKVIAAAGLLSAIALTPSGVSNADSRSFLNVAPVFVRGNGVGAAGCVMVVPPVFLSEQEALAIIKSVAESGGLNFDARPPEYVATNNKDKDSVIGVGEVWLRYYDSEKQVAVAYIPMRSAVVDNEERRGLSISSYDARKLAELTVEDLAKREGNITVGVFYEPGEEMKREKQNLINKSPESRHNSDGFDEYRAEMIENIEENLRKQVSDFIEWLQGEGII